MDQQQFVIQVRVEKTAENNMRGVIISDPNPLGENLGEIAHPHLLPYANGTVLEIEIWKDASKIKLRGVKVISGGEESQEPDAPSDWIKVGTEYFSPEEYTLFETVQSIIEDEDDQGVPLIMISGESGYGKTSRAWAWAKEHGMDYTLISCSTIRDPEEWFYYREAREGSTVLDPTPFAKALEKGNAVVVLDEVNRLEAWLANPLFNLFDFNQKVTVHGQELTVPKRILFVMTQNLGYSYVGTFMTDTALMRRIIGQINVEAPPRDIEIKILQEKERISEEHSEQIVNTLNSLRSLNMGVEAHITTGSGLKVAKLVRHGRTPRQAFQYAVINTAPRDMMKGLADAVNTELGVI